MFAKDVHALENNRLARLREQTTPYTFTVEWLAGKNNVIADTLSRQPLFEHCHTDVEPAVCNRVRQLTDTSAHTLVPIYDAIDDDYRALVTALLNRPSPDKLPSDHPATPYRKLWNRLSIDHTPHGSLVSLDCRRIIVPVAARKRILQALHASHAGCSKSQVWARSLYYWPGITNDINETVRSCLACQRRLPSQPQATPKTPPLLADLRPMDELGIDLFEHKSRHYVVVVDRYSGYLWTHRLRNLSTAAVTEFLQTVFFVFGYPAAVRTDGGPQFRREFVAFCDANAIRHELAAPYTPTSNGLAEAAVKNAKNLLAKCDDSSQDFHRALAAWRQTPRHDGYSPFELFFHRKGRLPQLPALPAPPPQHRRLHATSPAHQRRRRRTPGHARRDLISPLPRATRRRPK